MPILETTRKWVLTSTGVGKFHFCGSAQSLTFGIETSTNSTATVQIVHRMGTTNGISCVISTVQCSTGSMNTAQFLGPLEFVAPRVVDKTAGGTTNTVTVFLRGV